MLTVPSNTLPASQRLMARLYWRDPTLGPRFSVRYVDGSKILPIASGDLSGPAELWRHLLCDPALTLGSGGADLLGNLLFSEQNLRKLGDALRDALERFSASVLNPELTLPIFASVDRNILVERWTWLLYGAMSQMGSSARRAELVTHSSVGWTTSADDEPLRLPIDIECPDGIVNAINETDSFLTRGDIPKHGIQFHQSNDWLPEMGESDIGVTDYSRVATYAELTSWLRSGEREGRLKIILSADAGLEAGRHYRKRGARIFVPRANTPPHELLSSLIREISHDHPLHQVTANFRHRYFEIDYANSIFRMRLEQWLSSPRLYSDPRTNDGFRLSKALPQVLAAAHEASPLGLHAEIAPFAERLRRATRSDAVDRIEEGMHSFQEASTEYASALSSGVRFDFESTGLGPMSSILAARQSLDGKLQEVTRTFEEALQDPAFEEAFEQTQERKVDAELQLVPYASDVHRLGQRENLNPGSTVRLQVHIGQRGPNSLVVGEIPSVDPLLPPLEGEASHELDVVVFPKDFTFVGKQPSVRKISLPKFGGTVPVSWDLKVPELQPNVSQSDEIVDAAKVNSDGRGWISGERAELRFSVYYKNQLLQSFALTAIVRPQEDWQLVGDLRIVCDFSRTRRFGRLQELGDRFASLSLNKNSDGRHMLGLKFDDGDPSAIEWEGSALSNYSKRLREALYAALAPGGETNFLFTPNDLTISPRTETSFADAVRRMAKVGSQIFTELVNTHDDDVRDVLRAIRSSSGKTIQVSLLHPTFSLPWATLYDYETPAGKSFDIVPVCNGHEEGGLCKCTPTGGTTICLRGFWGFRHVIEQLVDGLPPLDDVSGRISAAPVAPTLGLVNTFSDKFTLGMVSGLKSIAGLAAEEYVKPPAILPLLRDDLKRPAVLLYVGHQINSGSEDAPEPELHGEDGEPILRLADISSERLNSSTWNSPRSLLMLLGCATGTTRVDTGISLAGALLRLGAVGVVGTECTVYTPVVAHLARELIARLANHDEMGKAMNEAIWKLADDGCPMGLIFTYTGPAEAHLP